MEALIAEVIEQHPEYHALLNQASEVKQREFTPDRRQTNPFLHMGMHIALREQAGADRPPGINSRFTKNWRRDRGRHEAEHAMMECLGAGFVARATRSIRARRGGLSRKNYEKIVGFTSTCFSYKPANGIPKRVLPILIDSGRIHMSDLNVGQATIKLLEEYGVDTVFGIPGVHTLEYCRGLNRSRIRHVQARNEQGAGFMADGYARASGKPGVALVISGPGVTNA